MAAPTKTKPPKRQVPESVKAFLLGDAYNGDPPGAAAGGADAASAMSELPVPVLPPSDPERSELPVNDGTVASPADLWARRYPHVTAEVLRQLEEDEGLTVGRITARLGVSRSTLDRLRKHYGRPSLRGRPQPAAPGPSPSPATEVSTAVLSTLPIAPFELHQRGRFNAAKLARILRGHANMLDAQDGEFEVELRIGQAGGLDADLTTVEAVINPACLTDAQLADLTRRIREVVGISVQSPVMAGQADSGPPEGGDDAA